MSESAREWLALYTIAVGPAMLSFWLPVHALHRLWRRIGGGWGYLAGLSCYAACVTCALVWSDTLLAVEFGGATARAVSGGLLIVVAFILRRAWALRLPARTLLGVPELYPQVAGPLVTTGAYARVRHPRYLDLFCTLTGCALLSDYAASYGAVALSALLLLLVIPMEERELSERYGASFAAYRSRVPALFPRRRALE
jgi:protein-S-isoprenylcysteine O-methyltransferase Ste14